MLRKAARKGCLKILLGWNRGLGDIALGLYAIVHRIREFVPNAEITFLTRENLQDGFTMLENVRILAAPNWKRGEKQSVRETLGKIGLDPKHFDLIIERPSPTDWVRWQRGTLVPKLKWDPVYEDLWKSFDLPDGYTYICVQPVAETNYGLWRNWPPDRWRDLFERLEKMQNVKVLCFGFGSQPQFPFKNVIDLRGKTSLFQLLSIVKNRCKVAILPDSGILSMLYYLDAQFPIRIVSLWADPDHGILKQGVFSPNQALNHCPLIGEKRDLSSVSAKEVIDRIFPAKPLLTCPRDSEIEPGSIQKIYRAKESLVKLDSMRQGQIEAERPDRGGPSPSGKGDEEGRFGKVAASPNSPNRTERGIGVILLAGGQGSRLGLTGPKGTFQVREKSLFQWICDQIPVDIPIAVMTSPLNHAETVAFFEKHRFFEREVGFFQQGLLPMLDEKKRPLGILAPDGNGSVFKSFAESKMIDLFEKKGIDLISIVPVENRLADPADPVFISFVRKTDADAALKCIERKAGDAMGALVEREGRIEVVEYFDADATVQYRYSYTGMMAMKLSFMKRMAKVDLPLHCVWKKAKDAFAWKREMFIFDALPFADRAKALCYSRSQIYAPLKSKENLAEIL